MQYNESKSAMENMKYEVANELGITLNKGYNGNLSSKDAGHIGGNMVRRMIEDYQRQHSSNGASARRTFSQHQLAAN